MSDGSRSRPRKPQFPARKTVYKGIEMRSRLEAGYAAWLDRQGWDWAYEPCAFAAEDGQYLPDFRIESVTTLMWGLTVSAYVEVKPNFTEQPLDYLATRMATIWASEPDALLLLQAPCDPLAQHRDGDLNGWSYLFMLAGKQWAVQTWLWTKDRAPMLGAPLPADMGPWSGDYWDVGVVPGKQGF